MPDPVHPFEAPLGEPSTVADVPKAVPEEAVQAAALAIGREYESLREWDREAFARAALEAAAPILAAQARADERRKVAEEIAAAIEARRCDQGSTFCKDCMCRREDAALARQIVTPPS